MYVLLRLRHSTCEVYEARVRIEVRVHRDIENAQMFKLDVEYTDAETQDTRTHYTQCTLHTLHTQQTNQHEHATTKLKGDIVFSRVGMKILAKKILRNEKVIQRDTYICIQKFRLKGKPPYMN